MNTKRDKFLTEAMWECWHDEFRGNYGNGGVYCLKCGAGPKFFKHELKNHDFSTWDWFGKLWTWAQEQEWWDIFVDNKCDCWVGTKTTKGLSECQWDTSIIHPDRFANAVYDYLKQQEG